MTLNDLKVKVDLAIEAGNGNLLVAYGDCNGYTKAGWAGIGHVEDLDEYIMEPVDSGERVFMVEEG
ncbi:hypothetical protein uav_126 [Pseudomonas phage UAVern]|uniref:Uncharacterized protein n=1 Tax=Pseudomonas phage UAVern TaxID=2856997 RepID=A0A975YYN7_9CAUD|nr:hypothetical protein uav_126 [Pseudomonas phage UAVern]